MKNVLKYFSTFMFILIVFCITLTISSMIPKKYLAKRVIETSQILEQQTNSLFIKILSKQDYLKFDNYSDALMINTAYSINPQTPFYSALLARKNYIDGVTQIVYPDTAGELKSASKYKYLDQVGELNDTVNNDITESFEYARYWHGYLIILRPLLVLLNISQIRGLFIILFVIISAMFLKKIYKEFDIGTAIIFLLGLIMCDYFYIGNSIQGAFVFFIAIIASIILLNDSILEKPLFFMIIGSLACFFDLLTVPVITLGMPLLVNSLMNNKYKISFKESIIELIKCCISWAIGFFGMWFIKWGIVDLLYHKGLIQTSIEQFFYRTENTNGVKLNFAEVLYRNIYVIQKQFRIAFVIVIIMTIIKGIIPRNLKKIKLNIKDIIIYFIIGCIPIGWYFVFKQHSYQHSFFTYRNLWLVITSILLIVYNVIKIDNTIEEGKEK